MSTPGILTVCTGSHLAPSTLRAAEHGQAANQKGDLSQLDITSLHLADFVFAENKDKPNHWLCDFFSESLSYQSHELQPLCVLPLTLKTQGWTKKEAPTYSDNIFWKLGVRQRVTGYNKSGSSRQEKQ